MGPDADNKVAKICERYRDMKIIKLLSSLLVLSAILTCTPAYASEKIPEVSAKGACLMVAESGQVLYEKNSDKKLPMASTTKLMTALVACERCDLSKPVEVSPDAVGIEGSSVYLKPGEKLLMEELLYALLLESANDAAVAIAIEVSGSIEAFAEHMNETAQRIGMESTHFTNPHGLDDEAHYTTAADLAMLGVCALKNDSLRRIVSTQRKTISMADGEGTRLLVNHNKLLRTYDGAVGMKTGFTKRSGRCLVSAACRDGVTLVAVTLSAPNDWADHAEMLDYGFETVERVTPAEERQVHFDLPVVGGEESSVRLSNRDRVTLVLPKGQRVTVRIEADRFIAAPVNVGDALGKAVFYVDGREVAQLPLFAEHAVAERPGKESFFERLLRFIGR